MSLQAIKDRQTAERTSIRAQIESLADPIRRALPAGVNSATFIAAAITDIRYDPKLRAIAQNPNTIGTIFGAIFTCAQLGLTPGKTQGHAWLIPRWDSNALKPDGEGKGAEVCTFQLGYKGLLKLARRTGNIGSVIAGHAFPGEIVAESEGIVDGKFSTTFEIRKIRPRPMLAMTPPADMDEFESGAADPAVVFYTIIEVLKGSSVYATMTAPEAFRHYDRIHPRKDNGQRPWTAWSSDYPTMAAISTFRTGVRFLETSTELDRALANENTVRVSLEPDAIDDAVHDSGRDAGDGAGSGFAELEVSSAPAVVVEDGLPAGLSAQQLDLFIVATEAPVPDGVSSGEALRLLAGHLGESEATVAAHVVEWAGGE